MSDHTNEAWYRGDWFQTHSGKRFFPLDPTLDMICIEDIAHALSLICRFGGHTSFHYSVAQHSVLVSQEVAKLSPQYAFEGLMHDAAEAYVGDMVRPMKIHIPQYMEVEHKVEELIARKFGLQFPWPEAIKTADNRMLMTERRDVLAQQLHWSKSEVLGTASGGPVEDLHIVEWTPHEVRRVFMREFRRLSIERAGCLL